MGFYCGFVVLAFLSGRLSRIYINVLHPQRLCVHPHPYRNGRHVCASRACVLHVYNLKSMCVWVFVCELVLNINFGVCGRCVRVCLCVCVCVNDSTSRARLRLRLHHSLGGPNQRSSRPSCTTTVIRVHSNIIDPTLLFRRCRLRRPPPPPPQPPLVRRTCATRCANAGGRSARARADGGVDARAPVARAPLAVTADA